ncbi:uncharacterized protein LOC141873891 isoform X3 [Acropora palmata]
MKSLQGLLVLKIQRLSEEELNLKWFKIREEVLVQKRAELLTERENLIKEKKETEETISYHKKSLDQAYCTGSLQARPAKIKALNRFANGALEFMANFDFCGRMREKRIVKFCSHQEKKQIKHRDDSRSNIYERKDRRSLIPWGLIVFLSGQFLASHLRSKQTQQQWNGKSSFYKYSITGFL